MELTSLQCFGLSSYVLDWWQVNVYLGNVYGRIAADDSTATKFYDVVSRYGMQWMNEWIN